MGGGADNACGAAGVGVVSPGDAVASWGTSGTVLAPTAEPKVDPSLRAHTFCHVAPRTWYVMGVMLTAGGAFAWYRDVIARELAGRQDATLVLNQEAEKAPIGAGGVTFLPYLQGERTPHRDASARGAFVGLSLAHDRTHLSRAVVEGICFGLRDSLSILRGLGLPMEHLLLTGGGAKSPFIRRIQSEVYGLPVVRVNREEAEASPAGASAPREPSRVRGPVPALPGALSGAEVGRLVLPQRAAAGFEETHDALHVVHRAGPRAAAGFLQSRPETRVRGQVRVRRETGMGRA